MPTPTSPVRRLTFVVTILALLATLIGVSAAWARVPAGDLAQNRNTGRLYYLPAVMNGRETTVPPASIRADLSIRPVPLRQVQRGKDLSVEYRFRNDSNSTITDRFSLFYQDRLLNFEWLDASNDAYIFHNNQRVEVEVRNVAPGETRTGRINFLVLREAPVGSVIGLYALYTCQTGATCQSNYAEVEVIAGDNENNGGTFTMSVSPDRGPAGTAHTFEGSRFTPGEEYRTWLNTPNGVKPLDITGRADNSGRIRFTFGTAGLGQGFYSMVAHGVRSNVQNVGPFIVQVNGQPSSLAAAAPALAGGADLAASASLQAPEPALEVGAGGVAGRVLDGSGNGVTGVVVEVRNADGNVAAVARTRTNGVYVVPTGLATGQYTVTAKPGLSPSLPLYSKAITGPVSITSPDLVNNVNLTIVAAGGLSGKVTGGGSAVAGVRVTASAGDVAAGADVTDATGTYTITNLPTGTYTLTFDPSPMARSGLYAKGSLAGQAVTAGTVSPVADFALSSSTTTGVISGKVIDDATAAGIGDVLVVISLVTDTLRTSETFVSVAQTADDGTYTSGPLPPDDYRVQFLTLFSDVVTTTRYLSEYFDNAATFADSDQVTVTAGASVTADAGLALGARISGAVAGGEAAPLAQVPVVARDGDGVMRGIAVTDAAGAYTIYGLAAGSYTVEALASRSPDAASRAYFDGSYDTDPATPPAATPVGVTAGATVTGINVTLGPGVQITGKVTAANSGVALDQVIVVVIDDSVVGQPEILGASRTDSAGSYSTQALGPGAYKLLFTTIFSLDATSRTYQDEYYNDAATLEAATPILVGKSLGSKQVDDVSLQPGGAVAGRVSASDTGAGLAGVFVLASIGTDFVGGTITDGAGGYDIEGLPAGTVTLTLTTSYSPDSVTRTYADTTDTAAVTVGTSTTKDFTLTPKAP